MTLRKRTRRICFQGVVEEDEEGETADPSEREEEEDRGEGPSR